MATALTSFYPHVRMDVPQAAAPILEDSVRNAAIEFCEETWIYTLPLAIMDGVATQPAYTMTLPMGTDISAIKSVVYDGYKIRPTSEDELDTLYATTDWRSMVGSPIRFYQTADMAVLNLFPAPETSKVGAIKVVAALKPSLSAANVPDYIYSDWRDTIVAGAKYRLFMMVTSQWGDPNKAAIFKQEFSQGINRAKALIVKGFGNRNVFVRPVRWWGRMTNG